MMTAKNSPRRGLKTWIRALGVLVMFAGADVALAQSAGRPDQVLWRNRKGAFSTLTGEVIENNLTRTVVLGTGGKEVAKDAGEIERVTFGAVPTSYTDGQAYADRGDFANAAAMFKLAATDSEGRGVVRAAARMHAARYLLRAGAEDEAALTQCKEQAERFLSDFPENRDVPQARMIKAKAMRMLGESAAAAESFRGLFREAAGGAPTPGYARTLCYSAGLYAADTFLEAGDIGQAREVFKEIEALLPAALAEVAEDDPERGFLVAAQARARLGEGQCLLADGNVGQAKTFFEGQLRATDDKDSPLGFGARMGLAEAHLAGGDYRKAQIEFARITALDHTDRNRVARALIGLAQCALELPDTTARADAKTWLETVREQFADTPSVLRARELAESL